MKINPSTKVNKAKFVFHCSKVNRKLLEAIYFLKDAHLVFDNIRPLALALQGLKTVANIFEQCSEVSINQGLSLLQKHDLDSVQFLETTKK